MYAFIVVVVVGFLLSAQIRAAKSLAQNRALNISLSNNPRYSYRNNTNIVYPFAYYTNKSDCFIQLVSGFEICLWHGMLGNVSISQGVLSIDYILVKQHIHKLIEQTHNIGKTQIVFPRLSTLDWIWFGVVYLLCVFICGTVSPFLLDIIRFNKNQKHVLISINRPPYNIIFVHFI